MVDPPNLHSSSASPTILVVDDEQAIRHLCAAILKQAGFTVLQADGSSEALKLFAQHERAIDLLLTDLVLPPPDFQLASTNNQFPHVHGNELAVRAATIRQGLRVALMSGNPDQELASHGIKRGTLPFLKKPFASADLVAFVRQILTSPAPVLNPADRGKAANDVDWFG